MFGLGIPEILFILLLATLILGPEHMPRAARLLGKWSAKARSAATTLTQAVTQDDDFKDVAHDWSKLQTEIQNAKTSLVNLKDDIQDTVREATNAEALRLDDEKNHPSHASTNSEEYSSKKSPIAENSDFREFEETSSHTGISGATTRASFFDTPIDSLHPMSPFLDAPPRLRRHPLAAPFLLPEQESRKVRRKRVALPKCEASPQIIHPKIALPLPAPLPMPFLRICKLPLPQNAIQKDLIRIEFSSLNETFFIHDSIGEGDEYGQKRLSKRRDDAR